MRRLPKSIRPGPHFIFDNSPCVRYNDTCFENAGIAQSVEQLIRNQQVVCSSHITSSMQKSPETQMFQGFFVLVALSWDLFGRSRSIEEKIEQRVYPTFSMNLMMIVAVSARLALPCGTSVDSVRPLMSPAPHAHCMAFFAQSPISA